MQNIFHGKTTKCRFAHIIAILAGIMLAFSGNALAQQQQAKPANAATPAKSPATANAAGAKPPAAANAAAASQPAAQSAKSGQSSAQKNDEPPRPAGRFVVRGENFSKNRFAREQEPKTDNHLQGPFYFVDENPMQVIKILEELTGQVAITSSGLPNAKINFASKGKLPRDEAILAIKSLLTANGMAVVQMGEKFFQPTYPERRRTCRQATRSRQSFTSSNTLTSRPSPRRFRLSYRPTTLRLYLCFREATHSF